MVAVSGGPDSLTLLFALYHLQGELRLNLHGAHLDHGLRGEASEADASFVAETFCTLGIGFTSERADVPNFQKRHRLSMEEAAREVRYAFLARVAGEQRSDAIALGHTSDDQAETVLMNILRGSALTGLRGMEPSARRIIGGADVLLVRPLLRTSKEDTSRYCRALDLEPRQDQSNLSTQPRRNRIRMELLPMLEEYNPAVREALIRLSHSAAQQVAYLDRSVDRIWQEAVRNEQDQVTLKKDIFHRLDPAIQAHMLLRAISKVKGDLKEIQQSHIEDMVQLMGGAAGRTLHLPQGIRFSVGYAEATVSAFESDHCPLLPLEGEHPLNIPGETLVRGWRVTATMAEQRPQEAVAHGDGRVGLPLSEDSHGERVNDQNQALEYGPDGLRALFSEEAMGSLLSMRARRPGDRFQPLGMTGQKSLKDFMVDSKIPRGWRDRVPLVVSRRGIAWVVGWRIADWAKVRVEEAGLLELMLVPETATGELGLGWSTESPDGGAT